MGPRGARRRRDAAITNNFLSQPTPSVPAAPSTSATATANTTFSATIQTPAATVPSFATTAEQDACLAEIRSEQAMLKEKIVGYDENIARLEKEIAASREVKEEVKEDDAATEKVKNVAAAGRKKKRSKKRAAVSARLGVSGFAPGENPHMGKFVFGKVGGWRGDLEWMMAVGIKK